MASFLPTFLPTLCRRGGWLTEAEYDGTQQSRSQARRAAEHVRLLPMSAPRVHDESILVLMLGTFNPRIVEPLWLAKQRLIPEEEANKADRQLINGDMSRIVLPWADLLVLQERLQLESGAELVNDAQLRDLAVGILRLLPHTPVTLLSIQRRATVIAESEEQWHNVGHTLAPKDVWEGILDAPGMFDFAMMGKRPDERQGAIKVRIQPMFDPKWGVWINVNDELSVPDPDEPEPGQRAAELLAAVWPEAESRTATIREQLYERLFT